MLCQFLPRTSEGRLFQFHSLFNHVSEPRFHGDATEREMPRA
jgi:hypothetical protein